MDTWPDLRLLRLLLDRAEPAFFFLAMAPKVFAVSGISSLILLGLNDLNSLRGSVKFFYALSDLNIRVSPR